MNQGFILSKRLLVGSIFGITVIGGALYINTKNHISSNATQPSSQVAQNNKIDKPYLSTMGWEDSLLYVPASDTTKVTNTDLNETEILTRNTLGPYIKQNQDGTYSKEANTSIVKNATAYMFILDYAPLTPSDIKTNTKIDKNTVLEYRQDLYAAVKPLFELDEYELTTYARAIQNNSKEDFDSLLTIASKYKQAGDGALALAAPNDVSAVHLAIINSLYKFSVILNELAKGYDDPAASLAGTGNFTKAENELADAFNKLKLYFILKGVDNITI